MSYDDESAAPMVAGRAASLPRVYGDTPSWLGVPVISRAGERPADAIVFGVPWEGTVTWGSFGGCELSPRMIRHAAARYGGYVPEYEVNLFDTLDVADLGDVALPSPHDEEAAMAAVAKTATAVYQSGAIPVALGGDHAFIPEMVMGLAATDPDKRVGVLHLDAHFDNAPVFGDDRYARCCPIHRLAQLDHVAGRNIVHFGIRGPRNSAAQHAAAREMGATVISALSIRRRGIDDALEEALAIATDGADLLYVTVCSDVVDAGFNPGGPADFGGIYPWELFHVLFTAGARGARGMDIVELYPVTPLAERSAHLQAWATIYFLAGASTHPSKRNP
ncbi:MAG: agmatinase family protein [Myxococcota bacterium]